jgi:hypothetical protein
MPTSWQQHAIVQRQVINLDKHDPGPVMCAWDDCEKPGYELYKIRIREGQKHVNFVFCTERHKQYWLNASGSHAKESAERHAGRIHGMLPAGYLRSL